MRIVDADASAAFYRSSCVADCSIDSSVTVDEIVLCVTIAFGSSSECPLCDVDWNGRVTIDELLQAVGALLSGCH